MKKLKAITELKEGDYVFLKNGTKVQIKSFFKKKYKSLTKISLYLEGVGYITSKSMLKQMIKIYGNNVYYE